MPHPIEQPPFTAMPLSSAPPLSPRHNHAIHWQDENAAAKINAKIAALDKTSPK